LADGYFVIPYTIGNFLASVRPDNLGPDHPEAKRAEAEVADRTKRFLSIRGKRTVMSVHRELGRVMWEHCGMARNRAGLEEGLRKIPALREEFWKNVNVLGDGMELNQALEQAGRVADFLELAELMCLDALEREESCGGHFRTEHQTEDGEARRDDEKFCHAAVWEYQGAGKKPVRHQEPLVFENVHLATRSYK
ncbi:MAG TPA: fumarate reductase/succinate dehydrogenase flavoprotein subunit, partial [Candidatus Eisenbacteria bacterium]|nr:fumarate reductase/succinate dehydrogenase flavoprotein subunit [Candidatus Eisenbacteria bacterium]